MALDGGLSLEGEAQSARFFWPAAASVPSADTPPATTYFMELTTTGAPPSDSAAGTELSGNGYNGGITINQSAFTYDQTSGVTTIANNALLGGNPGFGAPTADWVISGANFYKAAAGTRFMWGTPSSEVTAVTGAYVQIAIGAMVITFS